MTGSLAEAVTGRLLFLSSMLSEGVWGQTVSKGRGDDQNRGLPFLLDLLGVGRGRAEPPWRSEGRLGGDPAVQAVQAVLGGSGRCH